MRSGSTVKLSGKSFAANGGAGRGESKPIGRGSELNRRTWTVTVASVVAFFVGGELARQSVQAAAPGWITTCAYSHSNEDDAIVFPGQPGAAHLHDYAGARTTNAFSTADSLDAGATSCALPGDTTGYSIARL